MDEMEKTLREELEKHLDTLRRNLEVVPMDVLKTKYKKPYQELKESICKAATAYTRHVSLGGIRIKQKYGDEATSYPPDPAHSYLLCRRQSCNPNGGLGGRISRTLGVFDRQFGWQASERLCIH